MKPLSATFLFHLLAAATAFDPAADFCDTNGGICLTSFIWCNIESPARCSWPEGADPLVRESAAYAVVYRENKYNVTWRQAVKDHPVQVQWWSAIEGVEELHMLWSTNTTRDYVEFHPQAILDELSPSNFTMEQVIYGTEQVGNFIRISQPDTDYPVAESQPFTVQGGWVAQLVINMDEVFREKMLAEKKKWELGVGIGVGLGVPALMGLTWFLASRNRQATVAKTTD